MTNLGASIGTALAGAVLIAALTASFFSGIADNPDVPDRSRRKAQVELVGGVPFVSDADLEAALDEADVPPAAADAVVDENADARIDGLRAALAMLALLAVLAFFAARGSDAAAGRPSLCRCAGRYRLSCRAPSGGHAPRHACRCPYLGARGTAQPIVGHVEHRLSRR